MSLRPDRATRIGREPDNDWVIPDDSVSRNHATITPINGEFYLPDLGSANSTRVNGHRLRHFWIRYYLRAIELFRADENKPQLRRFTRLTNAFSRKVDNLRAAVALHFAWHNFVRIHRSLRVTPAIALVCQTTYGN